MDTLAEFRAASEANDLHSEGRIERLRPHLRPWVATTWFAFVVGPV